MVSRVGNPLVFAGACTCLTLPGVRTRATSTRTDAVERQFARMHSANAHRISDSGH
jgi:hypothetical protein